VHDDFAVEPIPGLPDVPPDGERILWQGAPSWRVLAKRMFHLPIIAGFFLVLAVWGGTDAALNDYPAGAILFASVPVLLFGGVLMGILSLLAYWIERTTIYTITSERVVIRYGLALPMTVNFPFTVIEEAGLRLFPNGSGNVTLSLAAESGVAFLLLWPHVRPWRWRTQPMLRGLSEARAAAEVLAGALGAKAAAENAAAQGEQVRLTVAASSNTASSGATGAGG